MSLSRRSDLDHHPRLKPRAIRAARLALGWSQQKLATAIGVTTGVIQRYESTDAARAIRCVSPKRLAQIAGALETAPGKLTKTPKNRGEKKLPRTP